MGNSSDLLIVIATYNEINSLPGLVAELHSLLPQAEMLVIDDNSPDGTGKWCGEFAANNAFLSVIHRERKAGLGTATLLGLKYAIENGFPLVATMDADSSHDPASLQEMYDAMISRDNENTGVMIGSRYITGGKILGWPWYRRLSSRLVNWFARCALGLGTKDNTSAFRIYRTELLGHVDLDKIKSTGYSYLEEILLSLSRAGIKADEIPITFQNRYSGKSKVNSSELASSLFQLIRLSLRSFRLL